jgi:ribosomal 30S subunit maturation factor RimM
VAAFRSCAWKVSWIARPPSAWLIGLSVADEAGIEVGHLVEVFRAGENEVYRIEGPGGELLIPALRNVVRSIDLEAQRMVVHYETEEV